MSILTAGIQKFYSSLKNLEGFKNTNELFDNISYLDAFFSEYRNVTFVIQKNFKDANCIEIYNEERDKYLNGKESRWFIDKRNEITKEQPFKLEKLINIEIYNYDSTISFSHYYSIDEKFDYEKILNMVKAAFYNLTDIPEVYFSLKYYFRENGNDVNILETIKTGINNMWDFLLSVKARVIDVDENDQKLIKMIDEKKTQILLNEIRFCIDYEYNVKQNKITASQQMFLISGGSLDLFEQNRTDLSYINNLGINIDCNNINQVFYWFITMHLFMYKAGKCHPMPVFMLLFNDKTFCFVPFNSDSKATFCRIINEIAKRISLNNITSVFYMGEYYLYDIEDKPFLKQYDKRKKLSIGEVVSFTLMNEKCSEKTFSFDLKKIDKDSYISEILHNNPVNNNIFLLEPIKIAFKNNKKS